SFSFKIKLISEKEICLSCLVDPTISFPVFFFPHPKTIEYLLRRLKVYNIKYYTMQISSVSDTRIIIIGSVLAFSVFLIGGFGVCFDYATDGHAIKVKCDEKIKGKFIFLFVSLGLIGGGVIVLVKGVRGKWDQNVKSDEMLGPKK